ncbi:MAG TPA: UDP-glucose/GDP-mannose dehydrogenase family protein [Thermodesulfobacteriota bacterium]|nr:UDP-glucose/GDP-mannose dehydrogenase family protein [Thermodesulfobacteriota bacterium]
MRISIMGLGYVGTVSAGCLAADGHSVIGVDPNSTKTDLINRGISPIVEKDIGDIIRDQVGRGNLRATTNIAEAVENTDISLICVGTPSQLNGSLDLRFVRNVCEQIGTALERKEAYHVVAARSTMLPGAMREIVIPTLEQYSGKVAGRDFGVCNNPEFLREGSAVADYRNPPKTVIGEVDTHSGDILAELYTQMTAPLIRTDVETAEMVKYTDNVWHALKVAFANEIGNLCKEIGIDSHRVMDIFCLDTKLNLSPYYLKPGFAFGGSCLPKDLRALTYKARVLDLEVPVLSAILESNEQQIERGLKMVTDKGNRRIGVLGFSFKAGTDDLRESPMVELIERLIGKGYDLRLYDKNVNVAALTGANRDYILNHIPHISRLMVDSTEEVLLHAETIVIGNGAPEFRKVMEQRRPGQVVVDLVRVGDARSEKDTYDGICW